MTNEPPEHVRNQRYVAGIDGCEDGWLCFFVDVRSGETFTRRVDQLVEIALADILFAAIDIPIGLLDGPRPCDLAARSLLAKRGSSVFPAPCRAVLSAKNYEQAKAVSKATVGKMISQQTWALVDKISEADEFVRHASQDKVFEIHPEVCFWALNGGHPMAESKKTPAGSAARLALLTGVFPHIESLVQHKPRTVAKDDVLDAAVAAWSALRKFRGDLQHVAPPQTDPTGLRVEICY